MFLPANITLQFGDSGDFVSELQRRLAAVKAHSEGAINGVFDGMTVNSVSSFQSRVGIRADGIAGPETLRRLNGVISGDSSGWGDNNHNAEEEAKQAAVRQQEALVREVEAAQLRQQEQAAAIAVEAASIAHHEQVPEQAAGPTPAATVDAQLHQLQQQQQMQQQLQIQQNAAAMPLNMGDMLAQMLLQQTAGTPAPQPVTAPPAESVTVAAASQQMHQQHQQAQHAQQQEQAPPVKAPPTLSAGELLVQQLQQKTQNIAEHSPEALVDGMAKKQPLASLAHAAPAPKAPVDVAPLAAGPQEEQAPRGGLISRAMQKMDSVVQRLSQHFETKLPPDVMREVEKIGQIMAQSGVREAGVPSGPEPARSQAPARGPEHQPAQRG